MYWDIIAPKLSVLCLYCCIVTELIRPLSPPADPDSHYIRQLPRRTVLAVLDELYIERSNLLVFCTVLLAAAGDLLKLLGWDMASDRAVESEQETVLVSAVDLRAKAAGFCFAFGRALQAIELHSLVGAHACMHAWLPLYLCVH
jgi:hypothetical protein